MISIMRPSWWAVLIRGIAAVLFGVLALLFTDATALALVWLFGVYALMDGVFALVTAFRAPAWHARGPHIIEGIIGIVAGLLMILWPGISALVILWFIAAWAIATGIIELVAAVLLRERIRGALWLGLAGVASILFGLIAFIFPGATAYTLIWFIGAYAIFFGVTLIALALRLRSGGGTITTQTVPGAV